MLREKLAVFGVLGLDGHAEVCLLFSRDGDLRPMVIGKTLPACAGAQNRDLSMPFTRTVTMLALARESLERFDNDADAAQAYLSDRLVNDAQLREALVRSAIEYERREMVAPS